MSHTFVNVRWQSADKYFSRKPFRHLGALWLGRWSSRRSHRQWGPIHKATVRYVVLQSLVVVFACNTSKHIISHNHSQFPLTHLKFIEQFQNQNNKTKIKPIFPWLPRVFNTARYLIRFISIVSWNMLSQKKIKSFQILQLPQIKSKMPYTNNRGCNKRSNTSKNWNLIRRECTKRMRG